MLREHVVPRKPEDELEQVLPSANNKAYSMTHCSVRGPEIKARLFYRSERGPIEKCEKCGGKAGGRPAKIIACREERYVAPC